MCALVGIILGFLLFCFLLISYLEYRVDRHEAKKLKENIKNKYITRTGALKNDRVNER
jgi:hypothetical protein